MAKWFGVIGFAETVEVSPGVWEEQITERNYYGDMYRNTRRLQSTDKVNDDININNELSILSDPYAVEHFHSMRYATMMGGKWKVTNVDVQFPRLILTMGGLYPNVQSN
jgi:hypothetical protein